MKKICKTILKYYLKYITKLVLLIRKPTVIAIAGSINKGFTKKDVKNKLEKEGFKVRGNPKNFNTEIGLPLAILNLPSGYNTYKDWLPAIINAPMVIFQKNFPDYLILTLGTSDEGDMKYLLSIVKPKISVVTDITQRYLEGYNDMDKLVDEYKYLSRETKDLLILNNDNNRVKNLAEFTKSKVMKVGFGYDSDMVIKEIQKTKKGQDVILNSGKTEEKIQTEKFGPHHAYSIAIGILIKNYLTEQ